MKKNLKNRIWWNDLHEDLKGLLRESILLIDKVGGWKEEFHDYAFIVFPAAKAYEGFLKNLFLELDFINEKEYYGKRFRIGKALNPSLDRRFRRPQSVYSKISSFCGDIDLANRMWETWKRCRNVLFHWFPNETNAIDYKEACDRVNLILETMDLAYGQCRVH